MQLSANFVALATVLLAGTAAARPAPSSIPDQMSDNHPLGKLSYPRESTSIEPSTTNINDWTVGEPMNPATAPSKCIERPANERGLNIELRSAIKTYCTAVYGPASTYDKNAPPYLAIGGSDPAFQSKWHVYIKETTGNAKYLEKECNEAFFAFLPDCLRSGTVGGMKFYNNGLTWRHFDLLAVPGPKVGQFPATQSATATPAPLATPTPIPTPAVKVSNSVPPSSGQSENSLGELFSPRLSNSIAPSTVKITDNVGPAHARYTQCLVRPGQTGPNIEVRSAVKTYCAAVYGPKSTYDKSAPPTLEIGGTDPAFQKKWQIYAKDNANGGNQSDCNMIMFAVLGMCLDVGGNGSVGGIKFFNYGTSASHKWDFLALPVAKTA